MGEHVNLLQKKTGEKGVKPRPVSRRAASLESPVGNLRNVQHLQRTLGNREVRRLLRSGKIQASLKIGQPNDKYEQEADRVANKVMTMPEPKGASVQRKSGCPECPEQEEIQTKPLADQITPLVQRQVNEEEEAPLQGKQANHQMPVVTSNIESGINSLRSGGGGRPLSESTRSFFESRFGRDFSGVRVHTGSTASETAASINAKAFTRGKDVVFGPGQYSPGTSEGKRLLGHELTHVVQQQAASKSSPRKIFPVSRAVDDIVQCTNGRRRAHRFSAEGVSVLIRTSCDHADYGHAVVEGAARDALDKIFNTECIAEDRRLRIQRNLTRNGLDIVCRRSASIGGACADSTEGFYTPANHMKLGSKSFPGHADASAGCLPLASTILHEIIHLTRGVATEPLPRSCEASCYPEVGGDPTLCQTPIAP